ncbi:hypothetical protein J3454_14220 [Erythrobacter sp. NFXS35]|uniref:hypothetical protein n=1 Tax=Erythrobacter sp. NFXS35 TaxID=2818436 RepID=UPI0032DFC0FF
MGSGKSCLGYPSRTAAVIAYRHAGASTAEIANLIGISPNTVTALEASAARSQRRAVSTEHPGRAILLPVEIHDALGPHAAKRGRSVSYLVRLLIQTVVNENMVDAVLDDGAEWGNA